MVQVMRSCVLRRADEGDRLRLERVAHVNDRIAIAEHMADEDMPFVEDNLHAIRPTTLVVARQEADIGCGGAWRGFITELTKFEARLSANRAPSGDAAGSGRLFPPPPACASS